VKHGKRSKGKEGGEAQRNFKVLSLEGSEKTGGSRRGKKILNEGGAYRGGGDREKVRLESSLGQHLRKGARVSK